MIKQYTAKILYFLLILFGILGVLDSAILSLYTNVNVGTLLPGAVGLIFIIYAYIKLRFCKKRPIIGNPIARKLVCILVIFSVLSFIIIEALIMYNTSSREDAETDYLIILGSGINGDVVSLTLQERLLKGIEYLNKHPDTLVIVSGGQGPGEDITEAEAMEKYLISGGISAERIIKEDKATSTMENFKFSKEILLNAKGMETTKIMIITSDFHMSRAKMLAKRVGFEPYGITCSTPVSVRVNSYAREYFAFVKSFFIDR